MAQHPRNPAMIGLLTPHVAQARERVQAALDEQAETVRDYVLAGGSWADVGRLLGVTRQSARERFIGHVQAWVETYGDLMPWVMLDDESDDAASLAAQGGWDHGR